MTIEELAEKIARFVGRNAEAESRWLSPFSYWTINATELMDLLHDETGIDKDQLGKWAEEESNKVA